MRRLLFISILAAVSLLPAVGRAQGSRQSGNGNGNGVTQRLQALTVRVTQMEAASDDLLAAVKALMAGIDRLAATVEKESAKTEAAIEELIARLDEAAEGLESKQSELNQKIDSEVAKLGAADASLRQDLADFKADYATRAELNAEIAARIAGDATSQEAHGGGLFFGGGAARPGEVTFSSSTGGSSALESSVQVPIPAPGTLTALAVNPFSNSMNGPVIFTVRLNGMDTSLRITVPAGSTAIQVFSVLVSVVEGDVVTLAIDATDAPSNSLSFQASYQYVVP